MRRMMRLRRRLATTTDARVKATNEFFSGIRIAKFMTWEPASSRTLRRNATLSCIPKRGAGLPVSSRHSSTTPPHLS
ncbi:hypothetical protein TcBrA4_0064910 [Trypanosoma cruzi]|nr:hypothetical protein TcBrA4_0064910 [Trypanosoma cruzi]